MVLQVLQIEGILRCYLGFSLQIQKPCQFSSWWCRGMSKGQEYFGRWFQFPFSPLLGMIVFLRGWAWISPGQGKVLLRRQTGFLSYGLYSLIQYSTRAVIGRIFHLYSTCQPQVPPTLHRQALFFALKGVAQSKLNRDTNRRLIGPQQQSIRVLRLR